MEAQKLWAAAAGVLSRQAVTNIDNQQLANAQPVTPNDTTRHLSDLRVLVTIGLLYTFV
jgi:hypothetical protein